MIVGGFISISLWIFACSFVDAQLPDCNEDELMYAYTECDVNGGRWQVQVPRNPLACQIGIPKTPQRGKQCGFSCRAGYYLELQTQQCKACPPGSYSLGSGVRFDDWNVMPENFQVYAESVTFAKYGYLTKVNNCNGSLWKPAGQYIQSNADDCTSSLSYSVNLQHDGFVEFKYQHPDSDMIFHFYIQNGQCQTSHDKSKNVFLNNTGTGWKSWKVKLTTGPNVLYWKTTGIMVGNKKSLSPVKIKDIEITGVSYTTTCHKCRPGFYASSNASHWCDICQRNTRSGEGASVCEPCDEATEHAPPGSETCIKRPPCTEKDYFATHSKCSEEKTTQIMYKWIEPKICLDSLPGSIPLPDSGQEKPCAPCNPGFAYMDKRGCVPCKKNYYSDGSSDCKLCPANTAPHYGYWYSWWDILPANMKTSCISFNSQDCNIKKGWMAVGDQIRTVASKSGDAYLILVLRIDGFFETSSENERGKLTFVFALDCIGQCQFYFMQDIPNEGTSVIDSWRGSHSRQTYTYINKDHSGRQSFTWAFQRSKLGYTDTARLYVVNVTDAKNGSADFCHSCALGESNEKCIPCHAGSYANTTTRQCVNCPDNTRLNKNKNGCKKCGRGTWSRFDKAKCLNNCTFVSPENNLVYNFLNLSSTISLDTMPSFTSTGRKYNHVYQLNICMNQGVGIAKCIDNVTLSMREGFEKTVQGMICRSTATIMQNNHGDHVLVHSQPTVVADTLVEVYLANNESVNKSPFENDHGVELNDVVYHMSHNEQDSGECSKGRHTFVYLRCDPVVDHPGGKMQMPQSCPDGTCDGCIFHFLWRSVHACPLCTKTDYEAITGSCLHGKRVTKYRWKSYPKLCKDGVLLPVESSEMCSDYTLYIEVGSFLCILLLLLMITMTCRFWKKSKKLEYKYHKLVVNSKNGKDDGELELPAADSCALSGSDSEYEGQSDEVIFQKKKSRILGKQITNYESVHLQPMTSGV